MIFTRKINTVQSFLFLDGINSMEICSSRIDVNSFYLQYMLNRKSGLVDNFESNSIYAVFVLSASRFRV